MEKTLVDIGRETGNSEFDEATLGPAMLALPNDRWRRFVVECTQPTTDGRVNYTEAARRAGYNQTQHSLEQTGHHLAHDARVQAAMLEEGQRRLGAAIPLAVAAHIKIMAESTKNSERQKSADAILDRAGIPRRTEHHVESSTKETRDQKLERAIRMAKELGLDPKALLGNIGITIDVQKQELQQPRPILDTTVEDAEIVDDWTGE